MDLSWRDAFGKSALGIVFAIAGIVLLSGMYNDLFAHASETPFVWLYAFGGIIIVIATSAIVSLVFLTTKRSRIDGEKAALLAGLFTLGTIYLAAVIFDARFTTAFTSYTGIDYLIGINYVISYFGQLAFGNIEIFWFICTFIYFVWFACWLKWVGAQKYSTYLKDRVKKYGS